MSLSVTIGGVAMTTTSTHKVRRDSISYVNALGQRDTFSLAVESGNGTYRPDPGASVVLTDSVLGNLFGGNARQLTCTQAGLALVSQIGCASWEQLFDRRTTGQRSYRDVAAGTVFSDLVTNTMGGEGITASVAISGPNITLDLDFASVREAFDKIVELASSATDTYMWDCLPDKTVRFYKQTTFAAPFNCTSTNANIRRNVTAYWTLDDYSNRVYVRMGLYVRPEETQSFVGNAAAKTFTLDFPVASTPKVVVAGVEGTVGVLDQDTGKDWYYRLNSPDIVQDAGNAPANTGIPIDVTYQGYESRVLDAIQDDTEVDARALAEGGTGYYTAVISVDTPGGATDAVAAAEAYLAVHAKIPASIEYSTTVGGLKAGMYQTVTLPMFGASATYILQSVSLAFENGELIWRVKAVLGALIPDYIQRLRGISQGTSSATGTGSAVSGVGEPVPGPPGASATPPGVFTIGTLAYQWLTEPVLGNNGRKATGAGLLRVFIPVTPPVSMGVTKGIHPYVEIPDVSSATTARMGTALMDGSSVMQEDWSPVGLDKIPYVATEQPFHVDLDVEITAATVIRVYIPSYSDDIDTPLVQAGQTGASPSALLTVNPFVPGKPLSGSNRTTLLVTSISQEVDPAVNVSGKLRRPISITVSLSGLPATLPDHWGYRLLGFVNGDLNTNPVLVSGVFSQSGLIPAGPDGIATPHTFAPEEPTTVTSITVYAVAGLVGSSNARLGPDGSTFLQNNIVPGITASCVVVIGTTTGVIDARNILLASTSAEFHISPTTGLWEMNDVDFSKASHFGSQFAIVGAVFQVANLSANLVITGALQVGGPGMVSQVKNFDTSGNLIGWVGDDTAVSGFVGAWFKRILIGGTSPATAKIVADSSGNVAISGTLIAGNIAGNAANISGTLLVSQLGTGTLPVGVVYAGTLSASNITTGTISASVSMTSPDLTVTNAGFVCKMNATNGFMITGNGVTTQLNNSNDPSTNPAGLIVYTTSGGLLPVSISPGLIRIHDSTGGTPRWDITVTSSFTSMRLRTPGGGATYTIATNSGLLLPGWSVDVSGNASFSGSVTSGTGFTGTLAAAISAGKSVVGGVILA